MKAVLIAMVWIFLVIGGAFAVVGAGFWAFANDHFVIGGCIVFAGIVWVALYGTTKRFTSWPPSLE